MTPVLQITELKSEMAYRHLASSHKKKVAQAGAWRLFLFESAIADFNVILSDRGDGGTRTLVQTSNLGTFYMLSFYLIFVRKPTKNNLLPA